MPDAAYMLTCLSQGVRRLTVRPPAAHGSPSGAGPMLRIDLSVQVAHRPAPDAYPADAVDVVLDLSLRAASAAPGSAPILFSVSYGGVFTLGGAPPALADHFLMVECPRILFPFARAVLTRSSLHAGFSALDLQPLDFGALWQARKASGNTLSMDAPRPDASTAAPTLH